MKIIFFIIFLFIPLLGNAEEFKLKVGKIKIEIPLGWKSVKNFLGIELMVVGPMSDSNRPVITVSGTNFSEFSLDPNELKKNESSYKEGREAWLKNRDGRSLEYYKYEFKKQNGMEVHSLGYLYILNQKEFIERSQYVLCKKNLYNLKSLILAKEERFYKNIIEKIQTSFRCE